MLKLQDIHVIFGKSTPNENHVLHGINLEIGDGEFVTVIGSNGAGKSTLLNVIAGDVRVARGRIDVGGNDVTALPAHRRSGFCARVFQDPLAGTCGPLTIEENLALAHDRSLRRSFGIALNSDRRAYYKSLLAPLGLGLEYRLKDRMELLSGGQRQAVSLLMATMRRTDILLLDEMTAALDPQMAEFIMNLTDDLIRKKNITTLMVTHSMSQALAYGTRTIMMHKGNIILDISGDVRESMTVDRLITLFSDAKGGVFDQDNMLL